MMTAGLRAIVAAAVMASGCAADATTGLPESLPAGDHTPVKSRAIELPSTQAAWREAALRRARVWHEPDVLIGEASLGTKSISGL